jgi:hypothetical protein
MKAEAEFQCPFCWEVLWLDIDSLAPGGVIDFTEDCEVCCHAIDFHATMSEEGEVSLQAQKSY